MVRRLKTEFVNEDGTPIYPTRSLKALEVDYSEEEREAHRLLATYCASREQDDEAKGSATKFVHRLLKKRLLSSPAAFRIYACEAHRYIRIGSQSDQKRALG